MKCCDVLLNQRPFNQFKTHFIDHHFNFAIFILKLPVNLAASLKIHNMDTILEMLKMEQIVTKWMTVSLVTNASMVNVWYVLSTNFNHFISLWVSII